MTPLTKSILIGAGAAALAFIIPDLLALTKDKGIFSGKTKYYKSHYILEVKSKDGNHDNQVLLPAMNSITHRLKSAGYPSKIKTTDKQELDIMVNHISEEDLPYVDPLLIGSSNVEFREVYQINEVVEAVKKLNDVTIKYLSSKTTSIPSPPPKKVDTSTAKESSDGLKEFEPKLSEIDTVAPPRNITSILEFTTNPYQGGRTMSTRYPSTIAYIKPSDTALLNMILADPEVTGSFPADARFRYGSAERNGNSELKIIPLYLIRTRGQEKPLIGNEEIMNARADYNSQNMAELSLDFNVVGARRWAKMTGENVDRPLAIIVNNQVISAPYVDGPIEGGRSSISGSFTRAEVKIMAAQLTGAPVPANFTILLRETSRELLGNILNVLLRVLIVFAIATGVSLLIFKLLKNS